MLPACPAKQALLSVVRAHWTMVTAGHESMNTEYGYAQAEQDHGAWAVNHLAYLIHQSLHGLPCLFDAGLQLTSLLRLYYWPMNLPAEPLRSAITKVHVPCS